MKKLLFLLVPLISICYNAQYTRQPRDYGDVYDYTDNTFNKRIIYMDQRLSLIKEDIDYILSHQYKESIKKDASLIDKYLKAYQKGLYLFTKVYDITDDEVFENFREWANQYKFFEKYRYLD